VTVQRSAFDKIKYPTKPKTRFAALRTQADVVANLASGNPQDYKHYMALLLQEEQFLLQKSNTSESMGAAAAVSAEVPVRAPHTRNELKRKSRDEDVANLAKKRQAGVPSARSSNRRGPKLKLGT
jgi:hypothetical protein